MSRPDSDAAGLRWSYFETAALAAAGATTLLLLHVPAGALVGAMLAVGVASLSGRPTGAPQPLQTLLFIVVGASVGAATTPDTFRSILVWPVSLVILVAATFAMFAVGYWMFRRFGACDRPTAFFAAAPGAFTAVMAMAETTEADMSRIVVAQVIRLAALTAASPLLLASVPVHLAPAVPVGLSGQIGWAVLAVGAVLGWKAAQRLKWPSASFLGPMAVSAALYGTGLLAAAPPRPFVMVASAGLGALVGTRFRGVSPRQLLAFLPIVLTTLVMMVAIAFSAGWLAGVISGVGPAAGMLAFAPGSMDVMIAIALTAGASPAYVAAHHTARLLCLIAAIPLLESRMFGGAAPDAAEVAAANPD